METSCLFLCFLSRTVQRKKKVKKKNPLDFLFRSILTRTLNNRQDENPHTICTSPTKIPIPNVWRKSRKMEENGGNPRSHLVSFFTFPPPSSSFLNLQRKHLRTHFLLPGDQSQYDVIHSWCCRRRKKTETLIFFFFFARIWRKKKVKIWSPAASCLSCPSQRLRHWNCSFLLDEDYVIVMSAQWYWANDSATGEQDV